LRTGSLLFLVGLRARCVRIHDALWHRINRHFARRLRQRTAYFRSLQGQTTGHGTISRALTQSLGGGNAW
jgi:hypothetical protein